MAPPLQHGETVAERTRAAAAEHAELPRARTGRLSRRASTAFAGRPARSSGEAQPYLVNVLSTRRRIVFKAISALWLLSIAVAVAWWIDAAQTTTVAGMAVNSAVLAFDAVVLPVWFLLFAGRMRRPNPDREPPALRVAMVVTKAPSEKWSLVRETLEAMLVQDLPGGYDVWLADEDPTEITEAWCAAYGVGITTRRGIAAYHRSSWPRRTKCKEGNLAYFYDTVGYDRYDVVVQLDADHVPTPGYLRNMVAPFADPAVGYVAAPSVCDRNADHSWSARGRLYSEALIHGAIQAGSNGRWAPCCIGSHYAVRTSALKQIGGLGPELAEDFSTSLTMASYGWEGVFALDAEAHGDGPESVADCVTQDFQWSRSMIMVALTIGPRALARCSWRGKLKLGFCLAWYPIYSLAMLASVAIPVAALITGVAPVRVELGAFYVHLLVPIAILVGAAYWLRRCGVLRPRDAKVIGWEIILFQLIRWPWALLGCVHALVGWIARREFTFKVTPKGSTGSHPLPLRVIAPFLVLSAASALAALLVRDAGDAGGYYVWALLNAVLYAGVALAVVVLHVREQPRTGRLAVLRAAAPKALAVTAVSLVAGAALSASGSSALSVIAPPAPAKPFGLTHDPRAHVAIGVTTDAGGRNVAVPWQPADLEQVNDFEQRAKVHAGIVMLFADWAHGVVDPQALRAISARGSVPEITWEPWDYSRGLDDPDPALSLAAIAAGRQDDYILRWARALRSYGKPVLLRFAQEMNAHLYPWAKRPANARGDYAAAWRHVHDLFSRAGATNVRWVWSPLAKKIDPRQYPGSAYVDVVSLSGFNGGSGLAWGGWRSFGDIYGPALERLESLAPGKPVQISEVSSTELGGSKAAWIDSMFRYVRAHPAIRSVVWFDLDKESDWRIQSSSAAQRAFENAVRSPYFGGLPASIEKREPATGGSEGAATGSAAGSSAGSAPGRPFGW